ncbi:glyoxalase [Microbacterium sp. dk485]|uniref:VOC family protein n=1 Tax=Microbacterium sp. dk485 TaxID=2560021 RepID=UPI0010732E6E|nr:VOC family protein [Microbacterium sp. dk485]TFV84671.1 glyoxalase [Microbacterium sp. dk485]
MALTAFYPVVQTAEPREAADFFIRSFGFEETFGADWYVSLRHGPHEVAFLQADHPTIPAGHRGTASGLLLNVEVDDAAGEYRRLAESAEVEMRLDLRDEPFGQRHFIFEGPGGVLVDVIEEIPPAPEYAAAFAS